MGHFVSLKTKGKFTYESYQKNKFLRVNSYWLCQYLADIGMVPITLRTITQNAETKFNLYLITTHRMLVARATVFPASFQRRENWEGIQRRLLPSYCKLLRDCFKYLLNRNHFLEHQLLNTNFKVHMKDLKVLVRWNWNYTGVCTISLNFKIFLSSSHRKLSLVIF